MRIWSKGLFAIGLLIATFAFHASSRADICVYKPPKPLPHVCGEVVDSRGQPIPDVSVTVYKDGEEVGTVRTPQNGQFDFRDVANGHYEVFVKNPHFRPFKFAVTVTKARAACSRQLRVKLALATECEEIQVVKSPKGR